jgi:hypothetical protein
MVIISNQITPGYLGVFGYTPQPNSYLELTGTLQRLGVFPEAPVVPGSSSEPPWITGPGNPNNPGYTGPFDYTILPKLPTQPNLGLIQSAKETTFTVTNQGNTISLGNMFLRGAWQRPITGLALGDATFIFKPTQSPFGNQSPLANSQSTLESIESIGAGATFEWTLEWPSGSTLIGRGYIINTPDIYLNSQGLTEVKLELGDELALFSNSSRLAQNLYCGRPPKTAQEAAKIYAQTNGLFTRT